MSQAEQVHPFFYEISIETIRAIDELVQDKFPWRALRRYNTSRDELLVAFWAVYEGGIPLREGKPFILRRIGYHLGQKAHQIITEAGRDLGLLSELTAYKPLNHRIGEETMAKTATAAKPAATPVTAKEAEAIAKKDAEETAEAVSRGGKAPGNITWVQWFKDGHAKGLDPAAMRDQYVEIRKPEYEGRLDILKRHAYRHLRLALPDVKLPKESAPAEPAAAE